MERYKGKWLTIDDGVNVHVLPETDIKPHSAQHEGNERELGGIDCPCKPKVATGYSDGQYAKPMIIHSSFQDQEYLDEIVP